METTNVKWDSNGVEYRAVKLSGTPETLAAGDITNCIQELLVTGNMATKIIAAYRDIQALRDLFGDRIALASKNDELVSMLNVYTWNYSGGSSGIELQVDTRAEAIYVLYEKISPEHLVAAEEFKGMEMLP